MTLPAFFRLLALGLGLVGAFGLPSAVSAADSPPPVRLRFLALEGVPPSLSLREGKRSVPVDLPVLAVGAPVTIAATSSLELYREQTTPAATSPTPDAAEAPVARVALPANVRDVLVVIGPASNPASPASPPFSAIAFAEDAGRFPAESLRVLNLTSTPVAVDVSGDRAVIPGGAQRLARPTPDAKRRVRIRAAYQQNGGWTLLDKSILPLMPASRVTCIAVYSRTGLAHLIPEEQRGLTSAKPGFHWLTFADPAPPARP